jgi:hypothetical protein
MNLLVHFGMTVYSVIHGPLSVSAVVMSLIIKKEDLATWDGFLTVSTLVMLFSGSLSILFIAIPYVSNASIDKFLTSASTLQLLWYHGVVLGTFLGNTGALASLNFFAELLNKP